MAIDFSLSELVALAVESFFYGALPPPSSLPLTPVLKNIFFFFLTFAGIYFALFCTSIRVLLNKRKSVSGAVTLLALAGVLGALITWVSTLIDDDISCAFR